MRVSGGYGAMACRGCYNSLGTIINVWDGWKDGVLCLCVCVATVVNITYCIQIHSFTLLD